MVPRDDEQLLNKKITEAVIRASYMMVIKDQTENVSRREVTQL